jgi:hypothetical protein
VWWLKTEIVASQEIEIGRTMIQGQQGQKLRGTTFPPMAGCADVPLSSSAMRGSMYRRITVQAAQGIKRHPVWKIINDERT